MSLSNVLLNDSKVFSTKIMFLYLQKKNDNSQSWKFIHKNACKSVIFLVQQNKTNEVFIQLSMKWNEVRKRLKHPKLWEQFLSVSRNYCRLLYPRLRVREKKKSLNFFRRITKNNFHSSVFLHLIEMYNEMGPE